jgi:hypothetical protein
MQDFTGWLSFDVEVNMLDEKKVRGPFHRRACRLLCIATEDIGTGETNLYYGDEGLMKGMKSLLAAPFLVGHNIRDFDIPALLNIYPKLKKRFGRLKLIDTLAMSRELFGKPGEKLLYYDLKRFGDSHYQPHALKNWGKRLNVPKMEDFEETNWETVDYSDLLGTYCMQDVIITTKLFHYLVDKRMEK